MDILSSDNASVIRELTAVQDDPVLLLRKAHALLGNRLAVMSSFGAESALLLAFVAEADPGIKVLFLNTGKHFPQTLAYRQELADALGLTNVEDIGPSPAQISDRDPSGELWLLTRTPAVICARWSRCRWHPCRMRFW